MNGAKNGSEPSNTGSRVRVSANVSVRREARARAVRLGVKPRSAAASRTRCRVCWLTPGLSFIARLTAPFDTPARAATSEIVGFVAMDTSGNRVTTLCVP